MNGQLQETQSDLDLAPLALNGVGTWDWDVPRDSVKADATVAEFFGIDVARAAAGTPLSEFANQLHPEDAPRVKAALQESIDHKSHYSIEYRILQSDGSQRWVAARGRCSYSSDGAPRRFRGVVIDISETKRTEDALLRSEREKHQAVAALYARYKQAGEQERTAAALSLYESDSRFRIMVDSIHDHAIFTINSQGIVTGWNRGAERLLGYTSEQIIGRNYSCFFTAEDVVAGVPVEQMNKALMSSPAEDEGWRIRADGTRFWANASKTALSANSGPSSGVAVILQDTTDRKQIAVAAEETARERVRLQERFLSHVSHELRTPLTAIYFFTSNVADGLLGDVSPEQREHLLLALENVNQLKEMVSDLLDITRVETHKMSVNPKQADIERLVYEVMRTCQTAASRKNTFLLDLAPQLPFVWADPSRVRQILTNLIDNAIKFTPDGGKICVRVCPCPDDDAFLCVSVIDTGCGIDEKDCGRVFDRLAQVESMRDASRSGLGLGLFITKELVLGHGGRIWVESEVGHGSTFSFTLPIFSVAGRCAHILTPHNLASGCVTLIALNVLASEADKPELLSEIAHSVESCIQSSLDVVLPWMSGHEPVKTLFIVACTDQSGYAVIAQRIGFALKKLAGIAEFQPSISSTTLYSAPSLDPAEQLKQITVSLEKEIQEHLKGKEIFQ
jgi:PAS domain S-box-containing protein